jgi:hypothetical protein
MLRLFRIERKLLIHVIKSLIVSYLTTYSVFIVTNSYVTRNMRPHFTHIHIEPLLLDYKMQQNL